MRAIKFRGKKFNNEWVYGSLIIGEHERSIDGQKFDVAYIVKNLPCAEEPNDMWVAKMKRVKVGTIGQFTTLRDKNGKDIYEGDILKVGEEKTLIEVRFVRGVFAFLWNGDLDDEFPCNAPTQEWAEVVGNIHDNPNMICKR